MGYNFIKKLVVYDKLNNYIRREVDFKKGMNLIVDNSESGEQANNTGKTTVLKLINVCLGSKDKKYVYTDSATNAVIKEVSDEIHKKNITAKLILTDCRNGKLEAEENDIILEVELKERGKRRINGVEYSYDKYNEKLNELIFENYNGAPTFRELIGKFVRVNLKGNDGESFLKYLKGNKTDDFYRGLYNYLFRFTDNKNRKKINELQKEYKKEKKYIEELEKRHGKIEILNQKIESLEMFLIPKRERLNIITNGKDFEEEIEKINELRSEYIYLSDKLDEINYELKQIEYFLNDINKKEDQYNLIEIFKDVDRLENTNKSFNSLVDFHKKIIDNQKKFQLEREKYFQNKHSEYLLKIKTHENNKNDRLGLVKEIEIEEYNELLIEVIEQEKKLSELEIVMLEIEGNSRKTEEMSEEIEKLELEDLISEDLVREKRVLFNRIFMSYSKKICDEAYSIQFSEEKFPLKMSSITEGIGSGRGKSLVISFDLSYLEYAIENNLKVPHFIVQDVLETVDEKSFSEIVKIVDCMSKYEDIQFIGAVLSEKVKNYEFISKDMVVEEVSEKDRFLRIGNKLNI